MQMSKLHYLTTITQFCFPKKLKQASSNSYRPKDTRAGTAVWLIQKETQDMATSNMEGMYDWMM